MLIKEQTDLSKLKFRGYAIKYTMNGKQYGIISFDDCGDTEDFYNMILNYNKMLSDNIISDEEYEDQISFIWGRANADYDDFMMDEREAMDDYTFNGDGKVFMDRELREMDNGKYIRK